MDNQVLVFLDAVSHQVLTQNPPSILSKLDGTQFEKLVLETAIALNEEHKYGLEVRGTPAQAFPDMVINRTGIEIKATVKDHWKTTGNSISESRRDHEIDEVYFLFGKLGGTPDIKIRPYSDCLSTILVTHNPRYEVNMELPIGESIFEAMGTTYDAFRLRGYPIREIRDFLRSKLKPGEELWWMGDSQTVSAPVLIQLGARDPQKEEFRLLSLALCPEILGNSPSKYQQLPALLLNRFGAVTPNMRDFFSAGGQRLFRTKSGAELSVRAVDYKLLSNAKTILALIESETTEEIEYRWNVRLENESRHSVYGNILNSLSKKQKLPYKLGDLFVTESLPKSS